MKKTPQVNTNEVKAFLAGDTPDNANIAESINYEDIKAAKAENDALAEETQEAVEENRSKLFEPDKSSLTSLSSWALDKDDLKVTVDEADKSLYLKAVLNDTPIVMPVVLEIGVTLHFRALSNYDFDVVFHALKKESDAGNIVGPAQYASRVQQAAVAMQLVQYGDTKINNIKFETTTVPVAESAAELKKYIDTEISKFSWPKWQAVVTGLRIFETKLAICNENLRNSNFWKPVGTA